LKTFDMMFHFLFGFFEYKNAFRILIKQMIIKIWSWNFL